MMYEKEADYIGYFVLKKYTPDECPSYVPIPHFHNSTEIIIVESGEYTVYTDGERRTLRRGDINFVESMKAHTSGTLGDKKDLSVYVIIVSDTYLSKVIDIDKKSFPAFLSGGDGFSEILELLEWNYKRRVEMNEEMKIGFITSLFGVFKNHFPFTEKNEDKSCGLLVKIVKHISENYKEEITLESLSRAVKYESTYLSRVFNRYFGMNLREYLNRFRISEFLKLKGQNPDAPNCQLSREVGFVSDNTFYRALNKYGSEVQHNF